MTNTQIPADRIKGSILGLAYGDAVGLPTESRSYKDLVKTGVEVPKLLRVSDDSQMALAVLTSLRYWREHNDHQLSTLRQELTVDFTEWLHDPDNNRAPGATCLSALRALERMGVGRWVHATSPDSAGCGSVMRVPWVGLVGFLDDRVGGVVGSQLEQVAMLQAVLTHGPSENAFCAAALAALTRALATDEAKPGELAEWLYRWADEVPAVYDEAALGRVHTVIRGRGDRSGLVGQTQEEYVCEGLNHVKWVAETVKQGRQTLIDGFWDHDPCELAGQGWRARECFAVAALILESLDENASALSGLIRAAMTNGDSDSIGAIAGALIGAARGDVWPENLFARLEKRYQNELSDALEWLIELA